MLAAQRICTGFRIRACQINAYYFPRNLCQIPESFGFQLLNRVANANQGRLLRMLGVLLLAFLFFAGANDADERCEDSGLIQMTGSTRSMWTTPRDLATVSPPAVMKLDDMELQFVSVVPTFGSHESYIALIHEKKEGLIPLARNLSCTGPNGSHRAKLRVANSGDFHLEWFPHTIILCDWPKEEAEMGEYEVFLEDANGKSIGQLKAKYQPSLLKQYGTMACVRNLWNDPRANVSGLADFPQWLEYHHMHGVEHFIIYTTSDMSPALREVYQPYIDEGLVTRVHLDMPAEKCWHSDNKRIQQQLVINDCLYRAKGHAKWLFPSLDVDEYVMIRSGEDITTFLEKENNDSHGRRMSGVVEFQKYRFARAKTGLEISSPYYVPRIHKDPKFAANVGAVASVNVHYVTPSSNRGKRVYPKTDTAQLNHYRHPNQQQMDQHLFATSTDFTLAAEVLAVEKLLKKRYGAGWQKFLEKVRTAPEPTTWSCEDMGANVPLKKGQTFADLS